MKKITAKAGLANIYNKIYNIVFADRQQNKQLAKQWLYRCNIAARQKKIIAVLLHANHIKDSTESRMNVLALFLAVLLPSRHNHKLRQAMVNCVVKEIEDSYRIEGVHDMVVGKRVKRLTAKLYARLRRYHESFLKQDKKKLVSLLEFYFGTQQKKHYDKLADYFFDCQQYLKKQQQVVDIPKIK